MKTSYEMATKLINGETLNRKDISSKETAKEIIKHLEVKIDDLKRVIKQLNKF